MKFEDRCPWCQSENVELESSTPVEWGNDDQGMTNEDWICKDCGKQFFCISKVEVVCRSVKEYYSCPYCNETDDVSLIDRDDNIEWYFCSECQKEFAVHPLDYYKEMVE